MRVRNLLPSLDDYRGLSSTWRHDVLAGITVGVVALPLALAFGVATGLGATAGVITAIVAGLVAAIFGGSALQVSGPTGAMTVVLIPLVAHDGAGAVAIVGIMAGVMLVATSVLGLGKLVNLLPWPVVEGFTVGIAMLIFCQEVPAALGVTHPTGSSTVTKALTAIRDFPSVGLWWAVGLTALVAFVMIAGSMVSRRLPVSLIGVVLAAVVVAVFGAPVSTIGQLSVHLAAIHVPDFHVSKLGHLASAALAVALLAGIESLLSAKVADAMTDERPHDPDRELFGQGLANMVAPLFGGMPATGAIARTAVNVRAGARTRIAAVCHSLVLVLIVSIGAGLVARIPDPALAGVLMVTAAKMIDVHAVRSICRSTPGDAIVLVLTAGLTLAFSLVTAVEIGVAVAAVFALVSVAKSSQPTETPIAVEVDDDLETALLNDHIVCYRLDGALFFGASQRFLTELAQVANVEVVVLRVADLRLLDATGARALGEIVEDLEHRHITVLIKGLQPAHRELLLRVGALGDLVERGHLFASLDEALAHGHAHVAGTALR